MKKLFIFLGAVAVLAALVLGISMMGVQTAALSPQDMIHRQLDSMGYSHAVRDEAWDEQLTDEELFLCYSSDEDQLRFFFSEDTGLLRWVDTYSAKEPGAKQENPEIDAKEMMEQSRYWAELFLGENRIGELVMEDMEDGEARFLEYYQGQLTGTSVFVIWRNGEMTTTITYIGKVFETNPQGQVEPRREGEKLSQEEAIDLGIRYIGPYASGWTLDMDTVEFSEKIFQGEQTYQIRVRTGEDENGFSRRFTAVIDPWTGEEIEIRGTV